MSATVEIYSTPTCHFCHLAKDFFNENDITFSDHDVSKDLEQRKKMMELTGQMGVPVISIQKEGDEEPALMVGFDEENIKKILGI